MVQPSDPRTPYNRKCAFDAGDYGLGFAANSLQLGCDCLGEVTYFDGVVNNAAGEPVVIRNAVCLHEEDHGLSWKHVDYRYYHSMVVAVGLAGVLLEPCKWSSRTAHQCAARLSAQTGDIKALCAIPNP